MNDLSFPCAIPDHWQNLLWAFSSSDIRADSILPWLPDARRQAMHGFFSQPEIRNSLEAELLQLLEQSHSRRLGIYFENLWAFAFQHHPDYRLLARNLPIRVGGKTLSELDFVVEHIPDRATEHWELAVKFYLQVGGYWVGPGLRDRLDIKLARMAEHQLPVAFSAEATATLHQRGIRLDRQWALMPGRLFSPLESEPSPAPGYWWADSAQFLRHFTESACRWLHLPKQSWLAPCGLAGSSPAPLTLDAITAESLRDQLDRRGPLCVAGIADSGEASRGFLVPGDWRQRATRSLPAE